MGINEKRLETFNDDVYNRRIIAENLTKIIDSSEEPVVISLDSEWGTGKTTFVTMWKNLLDTEEVYTSKFNTLYFNAWENDYIKDPLLALFTEIELQINEEDSNLKKNFKKVRDVILPMAKLATKVGVKMVTAGALDLDKVDLGEKTEDSIMELASKLGDLSIKEISASKSIRLKFKEVMSEYQKGTGKKMIFFIDELDRCRPTFAIELLEVIKHLFNIENCIFVISIDKEQLSHSVSTIYGQNMDTAGYLRRFFDLDYNLPKIDKKIYIDNMSKEVFAEYKNIELFQFFVKEQFQLHQFSLRDIDKAFYYIKLLMPLIEPFKSEKTNNGTEWKKVYITTISYLYSVFITMKIKNPIVYNKVISYNYEVNEIIREFKTPNFNLGELHVGGWRVKPLSEVITPILNIYLELALKVHKGTRASYLNSQEYMVGLKREDDFYSDNSYSLLYLFNDNDKSSIHNKLEFIDSFTN